MSLLKKTLNKVINSFAWRSGIIDISKQLNRIESKVDFLLHKQTFEPLPHSSINNVFDKSGLPVVFITDRSYLMPTLLAIFSLCHNTNKGTVYNVNLVMADCSEQDRNYVKNIYPEINIISTSIPHHQTISNSHVTLTALLKFDLPFLLPDFKKVLYLDGDVIVRCDLSDFINTPLNGKICGAVKDCKAIYDKYPEFHGLNSIAQSYFNSGVLLLDLEKMRSDDTTKKLWDTRSSINLHFVDQDCFNIVFESNVHLFSLKYNYMAENIAKAAINIAQIASIYNQSEKDIIETLNNPSIIHYSSPKPWLSTKTQGYEYYWQEKSMFDFWRLNDKN